MVGKATTFDPWAAQLSFTEFHVSHLHSASPPWNLASQVQHDSWIARGVQTSTRCWDPWRFVDWKHPAAAARAWWFGAFCGIPQNERVPRNPLRRLETTKCVKMLRLTVVEILRGHRRTMCWKSVKRRGFEISKDPTIWSKTHESPPCTSHLQAMYGGISLAFDRKSTAGMFSQTTPRFPRPAFWKH